MYGGLFGDLPSTKKSQPASSETKQPQVDERHDTNQEGAATLSNESHDVSSKKRPVSLVSSIGNAGTSMAFVPTALRNRKRAPSAPITVKVAPSTASASSQEVVTEDPKRAKEVSHIHSSTQAVQQAPALEEEESEAMRQLHASVVDPYDPLVPNDLLAYWDRKAMEKERLELEREAKATLERQAQLRKQLEEERESLQKLGNLQDIVQHREQMSMGRGRGRGVSNLPAWVIQKQKETLGSADTARITPSESTVILSNLTCPGDIDDDLAVEVKEECEEQCGPVVNVIVKDAKPPLQPAVQVHVQFETKADADSCVQIFHGRKFGSRRITAELLPTPQAL